MNSPTEISIPTRFTKMMGLRLPIIMAPMFLVSNQEMMLAGMRSGIMATFPTLNFRDEKELASVLDACNSFLLSLENKGSYGVNLIVQKTNPYYKKHLDLCVNKKVPFYITSLGNPAEVIEAAHSYGGKVFCDITNLKHAEKVAKMGCDGLIAVGQGAGGHAGPNSQMVMLPALRKEFPEQVLIAAGGIATGQGLASTLVLGADGVSAGTRFIATEEATVNKEYKDAIVEYGMDDIVMTDKISGTPCAVINTPYVQKVGTKQNSFERWLNKNRKTKKWFKTLVQVRGMKRLEQAALGATYKTMWCAGQTVQLIDSVQPTSEIVNQFATEYKEAIGALPGTEIQSTPESIKAK